MAVNEQIVTGRKFRKLIDEVNKIWQRISFWHKASDCEFDDGKDAETKLGAINGITDSLTSDASNIVASAAAVKALNDKITEINSNISNIHRSIPISCSFYVHHANSGYITVDLNLMANGATIASNSVWIHVEMANRNQTGSGSIQGTYSI